jgi:hypothetical protein
MRAAKTTKVGASWLSNQQWFGPDDTTGQTILFKAACDSGAQHCEKCLDLSGGVKANGTAIDVWDCIGNENQQWVWDEQSGTIRYYQDQDWCIDIPGGNTDNGQTLWLWQCNGKQQQMWQGGGSYQWISNLNDKQCLDLSGGDSTNGKPVELWTCAPSTTTYDPASAHTFVLYAYIAYCSAAQINSWGCKYCSAGDPHFSNAKTITNTQTSTQGYVGLSGYSGDIIVSFRGTQGADLTNWITNLKFAKTTAYPRCFGCEVHLGFYEAWTSVSSEIISAVRSLLGSSTNMRSTMRSGLRQPAVMQARAIFVTGHSLGAALAVLCAAELAAEGLPVKGVYTFGEPRVGNNAFHKFYNSGEHISWRVTHHRDPVPHLPPENLGFEHIATEVFYNADSSSYELCDGSGEDKSCSDQYDFDTYLSDHLDYLGVSCEGGC